MKTLWMRIGLAPGLARDESGAVLAEFASVFLIYLMVVVATFQISLWAFTITATQFAVWEGCRVGSAVYQPQPPDGTTPGGLRSQLDRGAPEDAAGAAFAAMDRIEQVLTWLPLTQDYSDLTAAVEEEFVLPGEEGVREITASVRVSAPVMFPFAEEWLPEGSGGLFVVQRACRLRLARFYSY